MFKSLMATAALVLFIGGGVAQAQTDLKVTIPFEFTAGKSLMPAGNYEIKRTTDHGILLANENRKSAAFLHTYGAASSNTNGEAKVLFRRYGDRYFFSEIWSPNSQTVSAVNINVREREMAQSANRVETASVSIPLR